MVLVLQDVPACGGFCLENGRERGFWGENVAFMDRLGPKRANNRCLVKVPMPCGVFVKLPVCLHLCGGRATICAIHGVLPDGLSADSRTNTIFHIVNPRLFWNN